LKANQKKLRFSRVYQEYKDTLYTFVLFRVGHDRDVAEDVVSDVFLKAYKSYDSYNPEYKVSTWLYTIARNTLIDHYRKHKTTIDIDNLPVADEQDPLFVLMTRAVSVREVEDALHNLPPMQQAAIKAQFFKGKTAKEFAAENNLSHDAARKHVSRGIASLRSALLQVCLLVSQTVLFTI
jgi:RNA polymerase sigma-70 factor (ECF subfamily)